MKVSECMTPDVCLADPDQTIKQAAQFMSDLDVGAIPVGTDGVLIGMLTDRDITIRAVANGKGPETPITEVMTPSVMYCYADESIEHVAKNMGEIQVRRLPVVDRNKHLVGIVALGDLVSDKARSKAAKVVGEALGDVTRRGGTHSHYA